MALHSNVMSNGTPGPEAVDIGNIKFKIVLHVGIKIK